MLTWDAASGKPSSPPIRLHTPTSMYAFRRDGRAILTGDGDVARLWDVSLPPEPRPSWSLPLPRRPATAAFRPDGKALLIATEDQRATLWDIASKRPIGNPLEHPAPIRSVAFSLDGKKAQTIAMAMNPAVFTWDLATDKPIGDPVGLEMFVLGVALSPDGKKILDGGSPIRTDGKKVSVGKGLGGDAQIRDAATGRPLGPKFTHHDKVNAAAYSPDGKSVATGGNDKLIQVWDPENGKPLGPPLHHRDPVTFATFSPDGTRLAVLQSTTTWLWDPKSSQLLGTFRDTIPTMNLGFSPDSQKIVIGAKILDVATRLPLGPVFPFELTTRAWRSAPTGNGS